MNKSYCLCSYFLSFFVSNLRWKNIKVCAGIMSFFWGYCIQAYRIILWNNLVKGNILHTLAVIRRLASFSKCQQHHTVSRFVLFFKVCRFFNEHLYSLLWVEVSATFTTLMDPIFYLQWGEYNMKLAMLYSCLLICWSSSVNGTYNQRKLNLLKINIVLNST